MSHDPGRRARLEALFGHTLAELDPAARVRAALDELAWTPSAVQVVAVGKAARAMAAGALAHLAAAPATAVLGGVVVVPPGVAGADAPRDDAPAGLAPLSVLTASHPTPDARSVTAARAVLDAVAATPRHAELLALISGGASALMALPAPPLTLDDKVAALAAVAAGGADIHELNTVRKHLSAIKGGRLTLACPAPITTLILSDVVGDDPAVVGSGPTVADPSTYAQACDIVASRVGWGRVPRAVHEHLEQGAMGMRPETPSRPRVGDRAVVIAGTDALIEVAARVAARAGMEAHVFARGLTGDVAEVARLVAGQARRVAAARLPGPHCSIAGGEPTIALCEHPGAGGRAQHLALLVARHIAGARDIAVLVAGSDGMDGNSDAAGAIVDGTTWEALTRAGLDPDRALARCDSHSALRAVGATLVTGPTGVNHADLVLIAAGA